MKATTERGQLVRATIEAGGGLLNQRQVSEVIGRNKSTTNWLVGSEDFPRPACVVGTDGGIRLWLHEEVRKWMTAHPKQGRRDPVAGGVA